MPHFFLHIAELSPALHRLKMINIQQRTNSEVSMSNPYGSLVHFLSRYKWRYVAGVAALITTDALSLVMPTLVGRFFQVAQSGHLTLDLIYQYIGMILGVALLIGVLRFVWRIYVFGSARFVEQDLRIAFFGH